VDRRVISPLRFVEEFGLLGYTRICRPEDRKGGDPLDWFMTHAHTVNSMIEWIGLYYHPDRRNVKITGPFACGAMIEQPPRILFTPRASVQERAYAYLRQLLNPAIARVPYCFPEDRPPMTLKPESLIDYAYFQLAKALGSPGRVPGRCRECGLFFISYDARQKYCPPPLSSGRSRCATRLTVRQTRERKGRKIQIAAEQGAS